MTSAVAAILFTVLAGALSAFQLALALGAPWGKLAWGGKHEGKLPAQLRVGSLIAILVYLLVVALVLDRAGVVDIVPDAVSRVGVWIVFGLLLLGTLGNLASRSQPERYVMTPVSLVLAILAFVVAIQGPADSHSHSDVGTFTVIGSGSGAVLCGDAVMESYPPQCIGEQIAGWDWEAVGSYETSGEVRWGEYALAVTPQGDRVAVTLAEEIEETDDEFSGTPTVTWAEDGNAIRLVTYGSSSCPSVVSGVHATRADELVIHLVRSGGEVCTADFAPHEELVRVPGDITERPVTVLLHYTDYDSLLKLSLT